MINNRDIKYYKIGMKTSFEIDKIKAVVLYILKKSGGTLDHITLFKKMYFAQQLYLVRYGRVIFNDSFRGNKKGPVPTFTYKSFRSALDGLSNATPDIRNFDSSFIQTEVSGVKYVYSDEKPDMDELAEAEVEVIDEVLANTKHMSAEELSELSHRDSAWIQANDRAQSDPRDNYMTVLSSAKAGGASQEILNYIRQTQSLEDFCR